VTTILCIEDEALLREDIVEELEDDGYDVLQAADGREGLEMILKHEPDLVICDITMPHMNGHDLVKTLREKHPQCADTPFIFLSAMADRHDILEGMNLGADDYLTKPIDFDFLLGKIKTSLRQVERMHARKEQQLAYMAHHDALTDLANRVLLRDRIEQALQLAKRGQGFAVLFLDLDRFKSINDTLGHPVGDELLKAVAERLQGCVREIDTIARLGGDEFAIVQALSQQPQDATALAQRIGEALKAPFDLKDHQVVVDTSIGIAVAPGDGTDPDELLKNADLALYRAKDEGPGQYRFFEPEMDARMRARRALEIDLLKALEVGEFELYYQPLVNLKENKVIGFEALLRWNHPKRGIVLPVDFISVSEEIGLINPLGEWVLHQACAEAATWPDDIKVAVNLSPIQFKNGNLELLVINALAASGLPANRLELEITESVLLQDDESVIATLHQLRGLGARIAMDDFGTGYCSLSYLRSFPFDKIKIDRSFVSDLSDGGDGVAIVRAIAGIARDLGMVVTAEGVETEEQLEIIRAEGCTEMQGYLSSRPRPAEEIARLFLPNFKTKADSAA
jgi:diguanylate cyclase (GGDEF)-like protein